MSLIDNLNRAYAQDPDPDKIVVEHQIITFEPGTVDDINALPDGPCFVYHWSGWDGKKLYVTESEWNEYDEEWNHEWTAHRSGALLFDSAEEAWARLEDDWSLSSLGFIFRARS